MQDFFDLTAFIDLQGGELVTDSRAVALAFGKKHQHVMRTIRAMHNSAHTEIREHALSNFGLCSFRAANGRDEPMYRMTAKGLSELAMGFTGEKARIVRIRFINAFEAVANRIEQDERNIAAMLHDLERREMPSAAKGQIGSRLMNERKTEKRILAAERSLLMDKAQPTLFTH
jgi:Rha family phage regulatory protein